MGFMTFLSGTVGEITVGQIWQWFSFIVAGGALISQALNGIAGAIRKLKAPNVAQDKRIDNLENWKNGEFQSWKEGVDRKLQNDYEHLQKVDEANRVAGLALIALLDHGIAGNNIEQMQMAKQELAQHLTSK